MVRDYVIIRLTFCSSFYFMTKNGVILHEMLSICALGFIWGILQPNIIQRYSNKPVVLEKFSGLGLGYLCRSWLQLLKKSNLDKDNMGAKAVLEFALKHRLISGQQIEEVVAKTAKIVSLNNKKGAFSSIIKEHSKLLAHNRLMSRQLQQQSQLLEQQANKVLPKILEQNEKLALEHAKEHTRQVSHNRIGLIITFGLAGISLLDNHYGFVKASFWGIQKFFAHVVSRNWKSLMMQI